MAAVSPSPLRCHFLQTDHSLQLLIYLVWAPQKRQRSRIPITNLLSSPVASSNIAPQKMHNVFNQWSRLAERSGGEIYSYGPSEWDSHIILLELQCCIIHFYCPAPKNQMHMRVRVAIIASFFSSSPLSILHPFLLTSLWHQSPAPSSPHLTSPPPPSIPLGNKFSLTNDLFCLTCLPLAMFSKWSDGNVSLVSASCWQNDRRCWAQANRAWLVCKDLFCIKFLKVGLNPAT